MNLLKMLPPTYQAGPEMAEIQRVAGIFLERAREDMMDLWAQFNIDTATWGLQLFWEAKVGIATDLSLSLDTRRSRVKAKLQGLSVTTPAVIKSIAERYTGGVATVEEHPAGYFFRVLLDGLFNVPACMKELEHSIAEIKPAHLEQEYALRYLAGELTDYAALVPQVADHYYFSMEEVGT